MLIINTSKKRIFALNFNGTFPRRMCIIKAVNDWTPNNVDLVFRHFIYTVKQIVKNKH